MKDKENYRHNLRCAFCGEFINYRCRGSRKKGNKFRCGVCKQYLSKINFQRDRTKRYGIRAECKKCCSKKGNRNKPRNKLKKRRIIRVYLGEKE